jgi:hypothetical protein
MGLALMGGLRLIDPRQSIKNPRAEICAGILHSNPLGGLSILVLNVLSILS